ncbi:MAG: hypothetical protein HY820_05650 [Acidobacteria bacterium]|nr:hypothetical protein [Acidobacteriota bacterium]
MKVGDKLSIRGYVTKLKFINGRDLQSIERILGFQAGRFQLGMWVIRLDRLPEAHEFDVASYSMVAEHRHQVPAGLNIARIKQLARESWSLTGGDSLVKIIAVVGHNPALNPDDQYPPGAGAPQWKLIVPIAATVVAEVTRYPSGVLRIP